jgi:hypothetical protein
VARDSTLVSSTNLSLATSLWNCQRPPGCGPGFQQCNSLLVPVKLKLHQADNNILSCSQRGYEHWIVRIRGGVNREWACAERMGRILRCGCEWDRTAELILIMSLRLSLRDVVFLWEILFLWVPAFGCGVVVLLGTAVEGWVGLAVDQREKVGGYTPGCNNTIDLMYLIWNNNSALNGLVSQSRPLSGPLVLGFLLYSGLGLELRWGSIVGERKREWSSECHCQGIYSTIGVAETCTPVSPEPIETHYKRKSTSVHRREDILG